MRPQHLIVGAKLRVTADPRDEDLRKAGERIEQRVEAMRAWLADLQKKPGKVIPFGAAAKS